MWPSALKITDFNPILAAFPAKLEAAFPVELQQIGIGVFQSTINSDDPLTSLSINTIEVKAEDANGTLAGVFSDWQVLAHGIVLLTSSTIPANATNHQVDISYRCGVTNSVFGSSSDYYEIDLDFVISPVP